MKPLYSEIDRITSNFVKLADEGVDPQEVEDWREYTYEGIEEEQQELYDDMYQDVLWLSKKFMDMAYGIMPTVKYVESKIPAYLMTEEPFDYYVTDAHILLREVMSQHYMSVIYGWHFAGEKGNEIRNAIKSINKLYPDAYRVVQLSQQKPGYSEIYPALAEEMQRVSVEFYSGLEAGDPEDLIDAYKRDIDLVLEMAKELRLVDKILPALRELIDFICTKAGLEYDIPLIGRSKTLRLPHYLAFKIKAGSPIYTQLMRLYTLIRSNAVEIANHTRDYLSKEKSVKRLRKKPKHHMPFTDVPKELVSYVFKTLRDRDAALDELTMLQRYFSGSMEEKSDRAIQLLLRIHQKLFGDKGILDWYRKFVYKKSENFSKLVEGLAYIYSHQDDFFPIFQEDFDKLFEDMVVQNGNIQSAFSIAAAIVASKEIVHNFHRVFDDEEIRNAMLQLYREGKAGVFKFDIIGTYLYAKHTLDKQGYGGESASANFERAFEAGVIDKDELDKVVEEFNKIRFDEIDRKDYDVIKTTASLLKVVEQIRNVLTFENKRENKNPELFRLDNSFAFEDKEVRFEVLRDRDPLHFFVGLETDCCQHMGGVGRQAVIDSYINKNAGVLVLYVDGKLIAQSYFHYVPAKYTTKPKGVLTEDLFRPVTDLDLSVRAQWSLEKADIQLIGELIQETNNSLLRMRTMGRKTLKEIKKKLEEKFGLTLRSILVGWPKNAREIAGNEELVQQALQNMRYDIPIENKTGVILDNVEANESRMEDVAISRTDLTDIYAKYAKEMAEKLGLDYVKCGKDYNALKNRRFESVSESEDPRDFKSDSIYTDFDEEDHIDLLQYKGRKVKSADIDRLVEGFCKLAQQPTNPEEEEDWRAHTYQGIEEELQRDIEYDIRRNIYLRDKEMQLYTEELRDTISGAEIFLRQLDEIAADVEYLISKGITKESFPVPMRASHVVSFINKVGIDGILNGVAHEHSKIGGQNGRWGNIKALIPLRPLVLHANNVVRAKGSQLLTKDLTTGKPSIMDSIIYWRKKFGMGPVPGDFTETFIKHLHDTVEYVKGVERSLVPIANMIKFLQSKSYTADDEGNKTFLELQLPEHLDFEITFPTLMKPDEMRKVYHMLRSNAVEIVNYTRSKSNLKGLKRIKKKPKDFMPMGGGLMEGVYPYIFTLFRNRDDALAEIVRVQSFLENAGEAWYFYMLYNAVSGNNAADWYREYIYKDNENRTIRNFTENWRRIEKDRNSVWLLFDSSVAFTGILKLCQENGDYRNILKIVSAVADSMKTVHNFNHVIVSNKELRDEILEVCRQGKGGIFKYEIVPKYFYAKSAVDSVEKKKDNIEKADEIGLVNKREFFNALNKVKNLRLIDIKRSDYDDIKKASTLFKSINNLEYIVKYEKRRQDKDPILFNLDEEFEFEDKKIEFKVLRDRDPLHFFIGLETDCCQSIGEPGHQAVVDSYINPYAGVIVMYVDGDIVAQSYFHYIPKATEEDLAELEKKRLKKDIKRKRYLLLPIDHMELSVRTHNMLERLGFKTVGDLAQLTEEELYNRTASDVSRAGSLGRGSRKVVKEVQYDLRSHKLDLGITIENWPEDPIGLSEEEEKQLIPTMVISGGGASTQLLPIEPLDNGVILDNVEVNPQRMRSSAISQEDLDNLYAKYAKEIAEKMGLNYVRCGKEYNKLSNSRFGREDMSRDPRKIMSKHKYSDFSKDDHIDLLSYMPEAPAEDDDYWADDVYASLHAMVHQFTKLAIS